MRSAHHIRQIRIDSAEALDVALIREFAEDCGIEILPRFPLWIVFVDGQPAAFYYAAQQVCIYPTVHPTRMSPRAFYEAACAIASATQDKYGNPVWLIDEHSKLNVPAILKKVGLLAKALAVYEPERGR